ncbi:hypothetical protein HNP52_003022 [Sphingomonas kyeonggiensis]|uniref:Uncharacterized protein n=1 Tax=Sphingomonas kyeonggiensis TaxID=1268553 RepID=A0A7W7NS40_9SPHN|nr:hypothetical protein [Sphingomonas kyeonggiensis]MBB4839930.1 hypothetical protein [Sphingomonas kyeonggiensis]
MDDFTTFVERTAKLLNDEVELTIREGSRSDFPGEPRDAADAFVSSLGFTPIGDGWLDLDKDAAEPSSHLANILKRDLVGHNLDWLSASDAKACAEEFYSLFKHGKVTRLANRIGNGWNPITSSTIEAAFVSMDDSRIALFLVEAED